MPEQTKQPIPHKPIVIVALAASFLFLFSQFLMITAYPTIMEEFNVNATQVQWLTTAFLLGTITFIPLSGYLMNTFQTKTLVVFAMVMLVIGTLVGATATQFSTLILSRVIQAVGAGVMVPLVQTILLTVFPREKRGLAMGLLSAVINVAPASAPSISGMVIDTLGWRALHIVLFVPAVIVLILATVVMKNILDRQEAKLDIPSVLLSATGFVSFILGLSMISVTGFSPEAVGPMVLGIALIAAYARRQLKLPVPVLNIRLFKVRLFTLSAVLMSMTMLLLLSAESILPMFAQDVLGTTAFLSGFLLLPGTILLSVTAIVAGTLFDRFGGKIVTNAGFVCLLVAMLLFSTIGIDSSPYLIMVYFSLFMLGCGLTMTTLVTTSMNALDQKDISHGSAITNTLRQLSMAVGVILLTTVISIATSQSNAPYQEAAHTGTIITFLIMATIAATALVISIRTFFLAEKTT
ncbi:MFS transporter [Paenalkalicoccus suaedae]|uniref:MFS transporter n=1 Tax=Paenalkalicoccus suaedae TaxID=2592382 RepID=A0A859FAY1_9BACI|nr:MFS transporter [Paenalkalicoccus suaedae]QKS69938.1 MFS transporter [Paenalkalicoccus suaedae]